MYPTNAVGQPREPKVISVAPGHHYSLLKGGKRLRHPAQVSQSQAEEKEAIEMQESIAQLRSEA